MDGFALFLMALPVVTVIIVPALCILGYMVHLRRQTRLRHEQTARLVAQWMATPADQRPSLNTQRVWDAADGYSYWVKL